ncbi:S-layer homology domain-containing protein [Gracilibacillus sp. YIM 98692]|uniref:S-layer homology domain-containing protein n=1 Tax=Gracilibacillus sp. YIM 98692 TaxID=2663532 RepID=UPI0013D4316B|nr:S-layer homology domain-containing protein [Gracilibacillus sp. YIM 98692]
MSQNKAFRKVAVGSLAATAAVAAVAPAVSADEVKDFTDVSPESSHYDAVQWAAANGITGYEDGSFGAGDELSRRHAAVFFNRIFDLPEATADDVSDYFDDVTAEDFYAADIAATAKAGIFAGYQGEFGYNDNLTRQQMAKVIVEYFDLEDTGEDTGVNLDNVHETYHEYVTILAQHGITTELDDFRPGDNVTRAQFATFLHRAVDATAAPEVESVSAIGVKTVEVKFNTAVDTDAASVQIKRGAANYGSDVEWNEAGDTATVTTVIELPEDDYSAVVTGIADEALTYDFSVSEEVESDVALTSTTVDDGDSAAQVAFVVENQYGEDMEVDADDSAISVSAYNVTQGKDVSGDITEPSEQYFELKTDTTADDYEVGDEIRFTVTYKGLTTQSNVVVADPSSAAAIEFGDIVLGEDDTRLNVSDGTVKLNYTLLDQYGNTTDLSATGVSALPTTIDDVQFLSSDSGVISDIAVVNDADGYGEIELTVAGSGTAVITAINNESGDIAKTTITVEEDSAPESVAIDAPTKLMAAGDEAFDLGLTVTDQYGDILDSVNGLVADIDLAGATVGLVDADDVTSLNVDLSGATVTETTEVEITITDGADELGTLTFDVEPNAVAQQITATSFPTVFEDQATLQLSNDDLTVVDQYGRNFEGTITVASDDTGVVSSDGSNDTITTVAEGTATLTIDVDGVTKEVDVKVIGSDDIESYTVDSIDTIYASDAEDVYNGTVALSGVDANGNQVKLVSTAPDFITSSNASVADIDSTGKKVVGKSEGTATISAWKGGEVVGTTTVTVSEDAPVASEVTLDPATTTVAVGAGTHDISGDLEVLDQYDVDVADPTAGFWTTSDASVATVTDGVVTLNAAGDVTIGYVTSNGLTDSVELTVNP